jgi:methionine-R-sulfoxide reductase
MFMIKLLCLMTLISFSACAQNPVKQKTNTTMEKKNPYYNPNRKDAVVITDDVWKNILSPEVYQIARQKGTERPFTSEFENSKEVGTFHCAACGNALFKSTAKFESGCGWPSFFEQENKNSVVYKSDSSLGMERTEALCGRCGGHLGHLFDDGPAPTYKRYCMNSIAMDFIPDAK